MLLSTVIKASNLPSAARNRSPFFRPASPASLAVLTSWPTNSLPSRRGTHSSSSNLIFVQQQVARHPEHALRLIAGYRRKVVKEGFHVASSFKIVEKVLERHACS